MAIRKREISAVTPELPLEYPSNKPAAAPRAAASLISQLEEFNLFGRDTIRSELKVTCDDGEPLSVPVYTNEFWTARQRQASSLHEISYRACFKPQLPRFFIERLTEPDDKVYDPFMGRGTTPIEAALCGRIPLGNDINPLSLTMVRPRLNPPELAQVAERLDAIPLDKPGEAPEDLAVFYHPETLTAISSLRRYLLERQGDGADSLDQWIAMVALNRLTGHSSGFFSVYTLPPNQAVSVASQRRINEKRSQVPPVRDIAKIILKKTRQLLSDVSHDVRESLSKVSARAEFHNADASETTAIDSNSVSLAVTSPPFLDIVQYATDNWLRCWFLGIDSKTVKMTVPSGVAAWREAMTEVLRELHRVVKPGGHVAFEVGEVHKGKTRLEEIVLPAGHAVGLDPLLVMVNDQHFTKTANCWGVSNMDKGTNTNRIVVFRKP